MRYRNEYKKPCPKCETMVYRFTNGVCGPCARGKGRPLPNGTVVYSVSGDECRITGKTRGGYKLDSYRTVASSDIAKEWRPGSTASFYLDKQSVAERRYMSLIDNPASYKRSAESYRSTYHDYVKRFNDSKSKLADFEAQNQGIVAAVRDKWVAHCAAGRLSQDWNDSRYQQEMAKFDPIYLDDTTVEEPEPPEWVSKALVTIQTFDSVCVG